MFKVFEKMNKAPESTWNKKIGKENENGIIRQGEGINRIANSLL